MAEVADANFLSSSVIIIIMIFLVIYGLPLGIYFIMNSFKFFGTIPSTHEMVGQYEARKYDLNMIYNSLRDIYLFSTYIPSSRPKLCNNDDPGEKKEEDEYIKKIILAIINIKKNYEDEYQSIKKQSYAKIEENLKIRESKEEKERLLKEAEAGKDARHNSSSTRMWIQSFISAINTIFKNILNILNLTKDVLAIFMPLLGSLFKNKVIMGFLLIVALIAFLLYNLKPTASNRKSSGGGNAKLTNSSTFSPFAIYNDIMDSYTHYKKTMNDLGTRVSDTLKNEEDEKEDDTIHNRELFDKNKKLGRYDNLSYINLNELSITDINGIPEIKIDKDKFYNIYLPSSKFGIDEKVIKWKIDTKNLENKDEIKWQIDCANIDELTTQSGDTLKPPVLITGLDNKCIINVNGLNKYLDSSGQRTSIEEIYSTEEIKDD